MKRAITLIFLLLAVATTGWAQSHSSSESEEAKLSIREVYPNPFSNHITLTLSAPSTGIVIVRLYDIIGNEVHQQVFNVQKSTRELDLQLDEQKVAERGVYLLKTEIDGELYVERLFRK